MSVRVMTWVFEHSEGDIRCGLRYGPYPLRGTPYVYFLRDAQGVARYVGSTVDIRDRMKCHRGDWRRAGFTSWVAFRFADRTSAYAAESYALQQTGEFDWNCHRHVAVAW